MERTEEQQAIIRAVTATADNLLIDARAGAGKTTVVLDALSSIPAPTTLLCAFNKRIQLEMEERLPPMPRGRMVEVKTLHSIGLRVLRSHFPHLAVPERDSGINATEALIGDAWVDLARHGLGSSFSMQMRRAAVRLLTVLKDVQTAQMLEAAEIKKIGFDYDLLGDYTDAEVNTITRVVSAAYQASKNFKARKWIDYCDMVWGPVVLGLKPRSRYKAICVDEAQDVSEPQFELIKMLMAPGGRLILVGDLFQSIYGWRGAIGTTVWQTMREQFNAKTLPLTITWRCPQKVVDLAREIVCDLKPRPSAPVGEVRTVTFDRAVAELSMRYLGKTFVLSRTNAELLRVALELWKRGIRFTLNGGRELIGPLLRVVDRLEWSSKEAFERSAREWFEREKQRAEAVASTEQLTRAEDTYGMLMVAIEYASGPSQVPTLLRDVLGCEHKSHIMLSTVHKVKGLEAERVYLLKATFARHRKSRPCVACNGFGFRTFGRREVKCSNCGGSGAWKPAPKQEELNIEYVAITRAKQALVWVEFPDNILQQIVQRQAVSVSELLGDFVDKTLEEMPEGDAKASLVAERVYGPQATVGVDGSVRIPEQTIDPQADELSFALDPEVPLDYGDEP